MALFGKKEPLGRAPIGGGWQRPLRFSRPSRFVRSAKRMPPPAPKGPFATKKDLSRPEFRGVLRRAPLNVPGGWGTISGKERVGMEKELFPYAKSGQLISEGDVKRALRELKRKEYAAKKPEEQSKIRKQRLSLEGATGLKGKY